MARGDPEAKDGGWGESGDSYKLDYAGYEAAPSTASANRLGAARPDGRGQSAIIRPSCAVSRISRTHQQDDGLWGQEFYTGGAGFPRVFYLRYHGYPKFFPLWALARYRNLTVSNSRHVAYGL